MEYKGFWKKTKRTLALALTLALFLNGWSNYDFTARAAGEYTVTLSEETAVYNGQDQLPDITVSDSERNPVDASDYNVTWENGDGDHVDSAIDVGTYECTVSASDGSGTGNYSGAVSKEFVISYDSSIGEDRVSVTGAVLQNGIWYFQNAAQISAADGYTLVEGIKTISEARNNVILEVKENRTGNIGQVFLGDFVKDAEAPTDVLLSIVYEGEYGTEWARTISSAIFSAADTGSGVKKIYYTTDSSVTDTASMTSCEAGASVALSGDTTYYYYAEDYAGNVSDQQSLKTRKLDATAPVITVKDGEEEIENGSSFYLNKDALDSGTGDSVGIDSVAPTITVDYPECNGSEDDKKYYRPGTDETSETVTLTFTEAYYDKQVDADNDPVKPTIHIYKNGTEDDQTSYVTWGDFANNQIAAEIQLPYEENAETEYKITATYQDGSGNLLVWAGETDSFNSVTDTDGFQSGILVLDDKAPELIQYSVEGDTDKDADGTPIYVNKDTDGDVTISFSIDDTADYWNPSAVMFKIIHTADNSEVISFSGDDSDISWTDVEDVHTAEYVFKGETDVAAKYAVQISYADRAGNELILNQDAPLTEGKLENGSYTSEAFILDHVAPEFEITFNEAFRLIDGNNKDYTGDEKTPVSGNTSYYGKAQGKVDITVKITEDYLIKDTQNENGIADFVFQINGVDTKMNWSESGTVYTGTYSIMDEGDYIITVSYEDAADNKMTNGDTVQGGTVTDGAYTSPTLILDMTAPSISTPVYTAASVNTYNGREYFDQSVNLEISITDQNIRYKELRDVLLQITAADVSGAAVLTDAQTTVKGIVEYSTVRGTWNIQIPLSTEANYNIPVAFTDLAGNTAVYSETLKSCVDTTAPTLKNLTETVSSSGFLDAVNYKDLGFLFADHKLTIRAEVSDETAGIQLVRFTVTDENGKKKELTKIFKTNAPSPSGIYEIAIPLETSDFKGTVKAEVLDWSNNASDESRGAIVESGDKHSSTGSAVITTKTSPSRTVDGKDFYNTDVSFNLTLKDSYSGLMKWSYTGGSTLTGSMDYVKAAGKDLSKAPTEAITYEYSADLTLDSKENNKNDVKVSAEYTDNTGHTGSVEQLYNIDITAPIITVEYNLNDPANERYYNQTRTATVTIQERNFDADDVDFTITNTDGAMPAIGSWSESGSGDDTKHVCEVVFSADGDYTFTVAFEDMAGNKAVYDRVDEFTIDQTKPVLNVTWNNNQSSHEYYYAQSRTATIDILEHNFDPALIDVIMTADGAGVPSVSGWSRNGDHNVATVTFSADADYTFDISGMDLADNPLDEYEMDRFVIDQTAPELEIFDIENMSANNGVVMPGVRYHDTNYDADATVILMKGYHNGVQEMNGTTTRTADGMEIKLNDFEHIPEVDDLYTMEATVYDFAGNSSEASVIFSVNRFGSVYTFDDATDKLVGDNGKYYTNQEQNIVVIETNVDTLEFREITCNLNGDLRTLTEGEDFTVGMSGSDMSWKQYTYSIDEKNFVEEGTYILTIYSEDRATNTSDNNTKGKKVEFVVDKTSPSILVAGVENNAQYRENSREVTLDVQDNIRLAEVEVDLDGEKTTYSASELSEKDGKIVFDIGSANQWQHMSVTAYDAAGNEADSEELRFLITSNILVQFYMNKVVFYSTIGVLTALGLGTWWLLILAKRKKEKETEE